MRLPVEAHTTHAWAIGHIAPEFRLLDVWAFPAVGEREQFGEFLEVVGSLEPNDASATTRLLFAVREGLGRIFGWDRPAERNVPGASVTRLVDRLPDDLGDATADDPILTRERQDLTGGFSLLYRTDDEWAAEISNATVHGVLHLAWVPHLDGRYRAQMGVYVRPRGRLGQLYMAAIAPFRHHIIYPALVRRVGAAWDDRATRAP